MENVRNRMDMTLVSNPRTCTKLINKTTFKDRKIYNDNLATIHQYKDTLLFDKPIYVGLSVLDISKTLMYDFHYNTMKMHYDDNIELLYMDTVLYTANINVKIMY